MAISAGGLVLLPWASDGAGLDMRGVAYALAAAVAWDSYVVLGKRVALHGKQAVASGMLVASAFAVPLGASHAGSGLLQPAVLLTGLGVALLSSTLPFLLEMFAMRHFPVPGATACAGAAVASLPEVTSVGAGLPANTGEARAILRVVCFTGKPAPTGCATG